MKEQRQTPILDQPSHSLAGSRAMRGILALCVTLAVLAVIFAKIDLSELLAALSRVGPGTGVALAGLYALSQVLSAVKWKILLAQAGITRSAVAVVRAYFAGMFFNSFGLGTVGGDLARALALKPVRGQRTAALASVAADRVHGLTVLLTIGVCSAMLSQNFIGRHEVLLFGSMLVLLAVVLWGFGPKLMMSALSRLTSQNGRLFRLSSVVAQAFPRNPKVLFGTTTLALLAHSVQISMHIAIGFALGIELPVVYYFAIIPLVNIVSCLPVSVQGIGVREGLYLLLLTPLGVQPELAVALGVIWVLVISSVSLAGGLVLSSPFSGHSMSALRTEAVQPQR